ncbi:hypothetical protein PQR02_34620 [Paraburkholderia sediminicola]|uniref:Uncharacterized protein n=1 Tax=Paraburkholderia rhynchosiae TaxID=487049 RepID=A0ACC7NML0_9BURK
MVLIKCLLLASWLVDFFYFFPNDNTAAVPATERNCKRKLDIKLVGVELLDPGS